MFTAEFWVNALSSAGYYALLALAIVFVYSTNRVLLFCVGEIGALAAFVTYSAHQVYSEQGLPLAAPLAVATAVALAAVIGAVLFWIIENQGAAAGHFVGTMVAIAFAIVLQGVMNLVWQGEIYRYGIEPVFLEIGESYVSVVSIVVGATGLAVAALLILLLNRSRLGYDIQALADNRVLSLLRGIPVNRRIIAVGALSGALAAAGGILGASVTSISLESAAFGVNAIVAAIIGGLTSPLGAVVGAVLLALIENLTTVYLDPRYVALMPILLLGIFLLFRPHGLIGKAERIQRV